MPPSATPSCPQVSWSGPVLLDLLGQIDTSFARFHGGGESGADYLDGLRPVS
jgi:hypothetical protein